MKRLEKLDITIIYDDVVSPLIFYGALKSSKYNLLCPIIFDGSSYQDVNDIPSIIKNNYLKWCEHFVVQVIGTSSLIVKEPIGILSKFETYYREANNKEINKDILNLGDSILSIPNKSRPLCKYNNSTYSYSGPFRIYKNNFITRVSTDLSDFSKLHKEVLSLSKPSDRTIHQDYFFVLADEGRLWLSNFENVESYDPDKLLYYGQIKKIAERILFNPSNSSEVIELSDFLK